MQRTLSMSALALVFCAFAVGSAVAQPWRDRGEDRQRGGPSSEYRHDRRDHDDRRHRDYSHDRRDHSRDQARYRDHPRHDDDHRVSVSVGHATRYETVVQRRWIEGYYQVVTHRVLVREAWTERVYVEPVYEVRYDRHGRSHRTMVCDGYYRTVHHPAVYEDRQERVWVPGRWVEERVTVARPTSPSFRINVRF